jgi:hypothetical protein
MSTLNASNLQGLGGTGTAAILASVNGGQLAGLRNRIINGDFRVDQRNEGSAQTFTAAAAFAYGADRWYGYCSGANVTGQRVTVAGAEVDPARYQFTGAASVTAIGLAQRIEAQNCRDLAGTTAALSVNLSNSLLTIVNWEAFYANTNDTFGTRASPTRTSIASGSFTVTSTYTRYSTSIAIPSAATTGIEIVFTVGAQVSGTWVIGQVQLEPGAVSTPFEMRPLALEGALCKRYFCWLPFSLRGIAQAGNAVGHAIAHPQRMRVTPTLGAPIVDTSPGAPGGITANGAGVGVTPINVDSTYIQMLVNVAYSDAYYIYYRFTATAEL